MNNHDLDPFELIRRGDPAPLKEMPDAHSPLGRAIRARVLDAVALRPANRRRWTVPRIIMAIGLVLTLSAATWLITRQASESRGVGCYEEPRLDSTQVLVMAPEHLAPEECELLWIDGTLTNPAVVDPFEVPPLTACVTDAGGLAVFPSDDEQLCQALGLSLQEPSPPSDPDTILNQRLLSLFADVRCLSIEDALIQVQDLLNSESLEGWTVTATASGSVERPCASFALDVAESAVRLVPIPQPPDDG